MRLQHIAFVSITTFAVILMLSFRNGSGNDYWLLKCDENNHCGYVDTAGNWLIPKEKYQQCYTDTFRNCAIVSSAEGFIGIDRNENVLFQVKPFDNGPDYPSEGVFRILEDGKIGYANTQGEIEIEPRFRFAEPFSDSLAAFSMQGYLKEDHLGEHWTYHGTLWGFVDHTGNVKIQPQYTTVMPFQNGEAAVKLDSSWIVIDKHGNKLREGR